MIGSVVGSYKITEKIGEGGMGAVYKGVDLMLEREVAIKMLRPELSRQPQIVERFRSEAVTLAKLNHPHIATLYSFLRQGDDFFMVMEFVQGDTLDKVIQQRGAMEAQRAVPLFCQALEGIEHAHRQGIVHRDIKPANMMLTREGVLKVMDFGIARVLGTARMTKQGNIIGTIEYMSPEQVRGQETDARSDIYSLGILLYEMLTGRVPFSSPSEFELMKNQIEAEPEPPRRFVQHIPTEIEGAILRALAKRPEDRFATASEFRSVLLAGLGATLPLPASEAATIAGIAAIPSETVLEPCGQIKETRLAGAPSTSASAEGPKETRLASAAPTQPTVDLPFQTSPMPSPAAPQGLLQRLNWKYAAAAAVLLIIVIAVPAVLLNRGNTNLVTPAAPGNSSSTPASSNTTPPPQQGATSASDAGNSAGDQKSPQAGQDDAPKIVKPAGLESLSDTPASASDAKKKSKSARTKEEERRRAAALKALDKP